MTPSRSNQEIYDLLMDINKEEFEQGHYEVAYHVLAAALHSALLLKELALLTALEQRAREQRDWLDTFASDHRLSSHSAALYGHESAYTSLVRQIRSSELMLLHPPHHRQAPS